jgi:hypothetical protein
MAYGQTSSGKSYTILGGGAKNSSGILPRFAKDIFLLKQQRRMKVMDIKCSFFEIYNEQIYDLLGESTN